MAYSKGGKMTGKNAFLMIRAGEEEKAMAKELAEVYGVSTSELLRFALRYVEETRPEMTMTYVIKPGKQIAPSGVSVAAVIMN